MSNENMEIGTMEMTPEAINETTGGYGDKLQTAAAVLILVSGAVGVVKFVKQRFFDSKKEVFEVVDETVED